MDQEPNDDEVFRNLEGQFDMQKIALDEFARSMSNLFKSFRSNGLSTMESAALTAAIVNSGMQNLPQEEDHDDNSG